MFFDIAILLVLVLNILLTVITLRSAKTVWLELRTPDALAEEKNRLAAAQSEIAEKRFSEGVMNVLGYEGPMGTEQKI